MPGCWEPGCRTKLACFWSIQATADRYSRCCGSERSCAVWITGTPFTTTAGDQSPSPGAGFGTNGFIGGSTLVGRRGGVVVGGARSASCCGDSVPPVLGLLFWYCWFSIHDTAQPMPCPRAHSATRAWLLMLPGALSAP